MQSPRRGGPIAWFVHNHVAANLAMVFVLVAGAVSLLTIRQEVFPEIELEMISVTVPYPGASPAEVEEAICTRIEEQIASVDGIKSITSNAVEGLGSVTVELEKGVDVSRSLDDIKTEVDRIITFPEEAEEPLVMELSNRRQVINLVVYGDVSERTLKVLVEKIRNDLTAKPNISQVSLSGVRPYEIAVEVSDENLRRHGLTFDQVAAAVRRSSLDLPGGSIKTVAGEILIRTKGQRYTGREFEDVVVLTHNDGTRVRLGEIATVIDGFDEDAAMVTRFDGKPAALLEVFRIGSQDVLDIVATVRQYIDDTESMLPAGVRLGVWNDRSKLLESRRDLLIRNGRLGLMMVFACLALFLDLRLAFWVMLGIPISFLGAFWLIPNFGASINMISLFAFIISLGIVVDDAIVVGENVYAHTERGKDPAQAAVDGAREMAKPVTFAVLTTVAAFMPLLYVEGTMGKFMGVIPVVVISVLLMSLFESLFVLPTHLSGGEVGAKFRRLFGPILSAIFLLPALLLRPLRQLCSTALMAFVRGPYARLLRIAVNWRYLTLALFIAVLLISTGWVAGGRIKFLFLPKVESDTVRARVTMPLGSSLEETAAVVQRIEDAARRLQEELNADTEQAEDRVVQHIYTLVGGHTAAGGPAGRASSGTHLGTVAMQLLASEKRSIPSARIASLWRQATGQVPGAEELTFASSLFASGDPIVVRLSGDHFETLQEAAERVKAELANYPGVKDINDSFRRGKMEMKLRLKPAARTLGLTLADLARQVRQGYYGDEALRIQRGRDDLKVMVRYPLSERRSVGDIERMRIRTAGGAEVPFGTVAEVEFGRGYASIGREERRRVISVTADVDEDVANAEDVLADLKAGFLPDLLADHPELSFSFEGQQKSRRESLESLWRGFAIALLAIYALLAIPFRSYTQPLIVMAAIPFGIVGAVGGHVLMGLPMTILSMFGIVALSGVVVNDSLVMIDYINRARERGTGLHQAVMAAGIQRFRPIMLTTLTTFFGLLPMILEKSVQAQFLIPMAISLGFGVVVATAITLVLVPASYTILEDILRILGATEKRRGEPPVGEVPQGV